MLLWPLAKILTSPRHAKPSPGRDADKLAARLAYERAALKQAWTRLDWVLKSASFKVPATRLWKHPRRDSHLSCTHSLVRIKLHVEVAMHERAMTVMSTAPAPHLWRQHLRRDVLFRTLVIQVKWLAAILAHAKTELASAATFRRRSADDCVKSTPQLHAALPFHDDMTPTYAPRTLSRWYSVLQLPLQDVLPPNDHTPSMAYLSFELFLLETGFDKSDVGQRLRHTAVTAHTADRPATMPPLHGLVFDIAAYLSHEHGVLPPCRRSTLDCLVRQMVHVRLAAAYCRDVATVVALAARKYDAIKPRMYELAVHDLSEVHIQQPVVLPQTRAALEAMPTFMPQAIAAAYMAAIRLLHVEVGEALHVPASTLSADVILPCLVGLFGQASLPDLAHQVHAMEMHLPPSCGEGEVAYYIALAHAALGAS